MFYPHQEVKFRALKSVMCETPVYGPMFSRTLMSEVYDDTIADQLYDLNNSNSLNTVSMAKLASQIARPSGMPTAEIKIENGFGERRILFMISLEVPSLTHNTSPWISVINGYTDYLDFSYNHELPDDMRFYIDNIQTINKGNGLARAIDSSHVITPNTLHSIDSLTGHRRHGYDTQDQSSLRMLRPQDVLADVSVYDYSSENNIYKSTTASALVGKSKTKKSRRSNGLASSYLNDLLKPAIQSNDDDNLTRQFGNVTRYDKARSSTGSAELTVSSDHFLRHLKQYANFVEGGYLTWAEMKDLIPNLHEETDLILKGASKQIQRAQSFADESESIGIATQEAISASIINASIGAMLSRCLITGLDFEFSNETIDYQGTMKIRYESLTVFDSTLSNEREQLNQLEFLVIHELLPILTYDNRHTISVRVIYDISVDSMVIISWDGGAPVTFATPTYCDSLFSPMLTTSQDVVNDFAANTKNLVESVIFNDSSTGFDYD